MINIQRPSGVNVGVNNPGTTVYIGNINAGQPANDTTDGSIRIAFTQGDMIAHIAIRENGIWNDTGLRVSSSSVSIGRDMDLSATAGFLQTDNFSNAVGHTCALVPHVEFNIAGSTAKAHSPQLNDPETFVIFSSPVSEVTGTTVSQIYNITPSMTILSMTFEVGTIAPTSQVTQNFYVGTDNTGKLFHQVNLPASDFVADTPVIISHDGDFGFEEAGDYFMEMVSTSSFSLKTDVNGDVVTSIFAHELKEVDMILDELILSNDLSVAFSNTGQFVIRNQFP